MNLRNIIFLDLSHFTQIIIQGQVSGKGIETSPKLMITFYTIESVEYMFTTFQSMRKSCDLLMHELQVLKFFGVIFSPSYYKEV